MGWYERLLKQTAVWWANPVNDGYGVLTFDDPAELSCRWEQRQELYVDAFGQDRRSQAVVYVYPSSTVDVGDWLLLGDFDDVTSSQEADPQTISAGAYEVRKVGHSPSVRGTLTTRKLWL